MIPVPSTTIFHGKQSLECEILPLIDIKLYVWKTSILQSMMNILYYASNYRIFLQKILIKQSRRLLTAFLSTARRTTSLVTDYSPHPSYTDAQQIT